MNPLGTNNSQSRESDYPKLTRRRALGNYVNPPFHATGDTIPLLPPKKNIQKIPELLNTMFIFGIIMGNASE